MSAAASSSTVNEVDVDNFFRCFDEATAPTATRSQRRRLVESATSLWRNLVSGGSAAATGAPQSQAQAMQQSSTPSTPSAANAPADQANSRFPLPASASGSNLQPSASAGNLASASAGGGSATSFRAAKEQGAILALTTNAATGMLLRPRALGMPVAVEIGKTTLSETERWKLQAALRREETKASGEKYNQNMLRETKVCKPPTPGEAFPAGRGRPVK